MTVQKYDYLPEANNINEIIEIDVEVFCGPFISSSGNIENCNIDEPDDACTRNSLVIGKSEHVIALSQFHKQIIDNHLLSL